MNRNDNDGASPRTWLVTVGAAPSPSAASGPATAGPGLAILPHRGGGGRAAPPPLQISDVCDLQPGRYQVGRSGPLGGYLPFVRERLLWSQCAPIDADASR